MTIQDLNTQLDAALRRYIKDRNHIRTGALYRSVKFECVDTGDLLIHYSSKFYIQYLEHRQFVDDFFKLQSTKDIINEYIIGSLSNIIYSQEYQP